MEDQPMRPGRHAEFLAAATWSRDHVLSEHPIHNVAQALSPRIDRTIARQALPNKLDVRSKLLRIREAPAGAGLPYSHVAVFHHTARGPERTGHAASVWGLGIEGNTVREQMLHFSNDPDEDPEIAHHLGPEPLSQQFKEHVLFNPPRGSQN